MLKFKTTKRYVRLFFIVLLTCLCMIFVGAGFVVGRTKMSNAEGQRGPSKNILEIFSMEAGAGIRLTGDGGIRFKVKMSESVKQYIVDEDVNDKVSLHFIITLKEYFDAIEDGNYLNIEKKILVSIPDEKIYNDGTDEYWRANGCVYGVLKENIHREYTAIAYIEDNTGGTSIYEYAAHLGQDNIRSIYYILNKAALDSENNYYEEYLKKVNAYSWYGTEDAPILLETSEELNKLYDIVNQGNSLDGKYYYELDGLTADNSIEAGRELNASRETMVSVSFDTQGGSEIKTQYIKKGENASIPENPIKNPFVFAGWELNGEAYDFTEAVTENITLKAVWGAGVEARKTSNMYYWTPVEESWVESEFDVEVGGKNAIIKNTKTFSTALGGGSLSFAWYFDSQAIQKYIDLGYEQIQIMVYYTGASALDLMVLGGDRVVVPVNSWTPIVIDANLLIRHYTYLFQAEYYNFTAGTITFSVAEPVPLKYNRVTYIVDSKVFAVQTVMTNGVADKNICPGYDIVWKLNGEAFDFSTPITESITLTASMEEASLKTIKFKDDSITWLGDNWYAMEIDGGSFGFNNTAIGGYNNVDTNWKFDLTVADVEAWIAAGYESMTYTINCAANGNPYTLFDGTSLSGGYHIGQVMSLTTLRDYIKNGTSQFVTNSWLTSGYFVVSGMELTQPSDSTSPVIREIKFKEDSITWTGSAWSTIEIDGTSFGLNNTAFSGYYNLDTNWRFDLTVEDVEAWIAAGYESMTYTINCAANGNPFVLFDGTIINNGYYVGCEMSLETLKAYIENGTTQFVTNPWLASGYFIVSDMKLETGKPIVSFEFAGEIIDKQKVGVGSPVTAVGVAGYDIVWKLNGEIFDFSTPITESITLTASKEDVILKAIKFKADSSTWLGDNWYAMEIDGGSFGFANRAIGGYYNVEANWKFDLTVEDVDAWIAAGYKFVTYTINCAANGNAFVLFDGSSLDGYYPGQVMSLETLKNYIANETRQFVTNSWLTSGYFIISDMVLGGFEEPFKLSVSEVSIESFCGFGHYIQGDVNYDAIFEGQSVVAISVVPDRFDVHKGASIDVKLTLNLPWNDILLKRGAGYTHLAVEIYLAAPAGLTSVEMSLLDEFNLNNVRTNTWTTIYLTLDTFISSRDAGYTIRIIPTEYEYYTVYLGNMDFVQQDIIHEADSEYQILISDTAGSTIGSTIILAASELQEYIFESTGVRLPIVKAKSKYSSKYISLGDTQITAMYNLEAQYEEVGDQGFYIKSINDSIVIYANSDIGVLYGVYEYLGLELNYDYLYTDVYTIDFSDTLALSTYNVVEKPDIDNRVAATGFNYTDAELARNLRMIKFEDLYLNNISCWHNSLIWLPKETYGSSYRNWYANSNIIFGTRDSNELCYTAHGNASDLASLQNTLADLMYEKIRNTGRDQISFACMDTWEAHCTCSSCRSAENTYGSYSGPLVLLMNAVAEKIETKLLAAGDERANTFKLVFLAYYEYEAPPTKGGISLNSHVIPMYAPIFMNFKKAITDSENKAYYDALKGWAQLAEEVYVWFYDTQFVDGGYTMVFNSYQNYNSLYPILKECNVTWVYFEGQMANENASTAFSALKPYLQAKLGWDTDVNYDELVDKFFSGMYGSQATQMKVIFEEINTYLTNNLSAKSILPSDWEKAKVENWLNRMAQIEAALFENGEIQAAKQVRLEKISQLYVLIAGHSSSIDTTTLNAYKAEIKTLFEEFGIVWVSQVQTVESFVSTWN